MASRFDRVLDVELGACQRLRRRSKLCLGQGSRGSLNPDEGNFCRGAGQHLLGCSASRLVIRQELGRLLEVAPCFHVSSLTLLALGEVREQTWARLDFQSFS